jgi:N-formylglutamate amidohydrolase
VLLQVLHFLQAPPPDDMAPMLRAGKVPDVAAGVPPMLPQTRQRLQHFYQPYNQQLAHLLSDAKYAEWS